MSEFQFAKYKYFLFSENPDELVKFYINSLGCTIRKKLDFPKDYGYSVRSNDQYDFWLAKHDQVHGKNQDPYRHMLNIYTDHVQPVFEKVKEYPGVTIVQEPICMGEFAPGETNFVCTILDPDGNCLQFMGQL